MNDTDLVLDADAIDALRELGGEEEPDFLETLIRMYLDDSPERLAEIESAADEGDVEGMERAAHSLKSSSGNLGARRLQKLCLEIEMASRDGDVEAARALVGRVRAEFEAVCSALEGELA